MSGWRAAAGAGAEEAPINTIPGKLIYCICFENCVSRKDDAIFKPEMKLHLFFTGCIKRKDNAIYLGSL